MLIGLHSPHSLSVEEVLASLGSQPEGLSPEEAVLRLHAYGPNVLREIPLTPAWRVLAGQFTSLLIVILLIAAVLSAFLGETLDAAVILTIVVLSAVVGFLQEWRAEKAVAALKRMAAPRARVLREGMTYTIPAAETVSRGTSSCCLPATGSQPTAGSSRRQISRSRKPP